MAEIGAAVVGGGFALAVAGYSTGTGFAARHETAHAQQVAEMKRLVADFEEAYKRGDVTEHDWQEFLIIRQKAREVEGEYEDSVELYKAAPVYQFVRKWKNMHHVRKKKELRRINRSLRSHYYDSTSDASDTSSITANSGSPPRSRASRYSDEDDKRILSWSKDVEDSDDEHLVAHERMSLCCIKAVLHGHEAPINATSFSPDSKRIFSVSATFTAQIWDLEIAKATTLRPCASHKAVASTFSPDNRRVASESGNNTIRIWDVETGETIVELLEGHTGKINSVAFSSDGRRLVSGSDDGTIRIWDLKTRTTFVGPMRGHMGWILSVAFSLDGRRVVSGSRDKTVRIWDAQTGELIIGPLEGHTGWAYSVAFSSDGTRVVSASSDETIRIWDVKTGKTIIGPMRGHTDCIRCVALSSDGKRVVSGSNDKTIIIWDAETGECIVGPLKGHTDWVISVTFSPDGRFVASGSPDHAVRIWDATSPGPS